VVIVLHVIRLVKPALEALLPIVWHALMDDSSLERLAQHAAQIAKLVQALLLIV